MNRYRHPFRWSIKREFNVSYPSPSSAKAIVALLLSALVTTACGGGGADDPVAPPAVPTDAVPDSAIASVRAYTEFAGQLIADKRAAGAGTPLRLNSASAPVSETDSPLPVD